MSTSPMNSTGKRPGSKDEKRPISNYKINLGDRKLPRPIVFWSDNEKDAFRRNKIVQTKYHMMLDDIETQQKASQRNIKFEEHKFRQKSARFLKDLTKINLTLNSASDFTEKQNEESTRTMSTPVADDNNGSSVCESDEETEILDINNQKGKMITKAKKSIVKFSVYTETFPCDEPNSDVQKNVISSHKYSKQRCMSASQPRYTQDIQMTRLPRSKSVIPENSSICFDNNSNYSRRNSFNSQRQYPREPEKKLFFDKSHAAYNLRQELHRLAKLRKKGNVTPTYDVHDYLKIERERYSNSRLKVNEYLRTFDREEMVQSSFED